MKKNLFSKLIFVMSLLSFTSLVFIGCKDEAKEEQEEEKYVYVSPSSLTFPAEGGSQTVSLNTNTRVSVYSPSSWAKASVNGRSCEVTVSQNISTDSRNVTLRVSGDGAPSVEIKVTQSGKNQGGSGSGDDDTSSGLSAPQNVSATNTGTSSSPKVRVSWSSVSGATGYKLYRSSSASGSYAQLNSSSSTYIMDNSPMAGANYYKVKAYNNKGESDYSSYVVFENGGGDPTPQKPNAPTGVTVENQGSTMVPTVRISCNSVEGATSYIFYRSTSANGNYTQLTTNTSPFTFDANPKQGNNYYKVKAKNSTGESPYSDYALFNFNPNDVEPCPVSYGNCSVTSTTITLRWSVSTSNGCGKPDRAILRVRNPQSGNYADLETLSGTATSASFAYGMWVDSDGFVYCGIILENSKGTSGGVPKVYDTKNKRWIN